MALQGANFSTVSQGMQSILLRSVNVQLKNYTKRKDTCSAEPSDTLPTWRPHSLPAASSHHQRPSRSCWFGRTGRVQGWQPMDTYPLLCSSLTGTSWVAITTEHQPEELMINSRLQDSAQHGCFSVHRHGAMPRTMHPLQS